MDRPRTRKADEDPRTSPTAWHILVADDEPADRELAEGILGHAGYSVATVEDGQAAWEALQIAPTDLVVSDLFMPRMDGMALLRAVGELPEPPAVLVVTAFASLESAVEATKRGAYGYLTKPISGERLLHLVRRALEERYLSQENRRLQRELAGRRGLDQIVGQSPPIRELLRLIEEVAPSEATILLLGKSGTGKELVARAIHGLSGRKDRPFVAVNCGGLSETLLESELFGHVRGAFTGAVAPKRGLIQAADGGTLFLDEVGEMSPALQVKVLRTLENGKVRPLGSEKSVTVNIRVIAATNRDLRQAMAKGRFREDLFYRLNVISFTLPDLAERREDIPLLAQHFLKQECARAGRTSLRIAPAALDLLQSYQWPGNIREFRNAITRAVALARGGEIRPPISPQRSVSPIRSSGGPGGGERRRWWIWSGRPSSTPCSRRRAIGLPLPASSGSPNAVSTGNSTAIRFEIFPCHNRSLTLFPARTAACPDVSRCLSDQCEDTGRLLTC